MDASSLSTASSAADAPVDCTMSGADKKSSSLSSAHAVVAGGSAFSAPAGCGDCVATPLAVWGGRFPRSVTVATPSSSELLSNNELCFALVCLGLGHNTMEMIYGGFAVYLFTLVAAVEGAWLLPEDIRNSSSVRRLTHWLRFRWD